MAIQQDTPVNLTSEDVLTYVNAEFNKVALSLDRLEQMVLDQTNAVPAKPRDGMLKYADGVNWNPGGGQGIYAYYAGVWNKL